MTNVNLIPKTIHYCWFGKNKKTTLAKLCINSWKKFCVGYQFVEWNEDNYDVNKFQFSKEAFDKKKYGFVVDPIRLDIIYNYGGIYLDCDMQLFNNLDEFLKYDAFFAFQKKSIKNIQFEIALGLGFGAIKGSKIVKDCLQLYTNIHFDMLPSPTREKEVFQKMYNIPYNGQTQIVDNMLFLNANVLCPMGWKDKKIKAKPYTKGIHWYTMSWKK